MANALKKIRKKTNVCLLFLFLSCLLEMLGIEGLQGHSFVYFPDLPFCSASFKKGSEHVRCCCLVFVSPLCKCASGACKAGLTVVGVLLLWCVWVFVVLSRQSLTM